MGAFLLAAVAAGKLFPEAVQQSTKGGMLSEPAYVIGGALIGFGTRLGR